VEQPATRYARSGDLAIAYQVIGDGPEDLVLAPGFLSHVELAWEEPSLRRFLLRLASFRRLIVFDKRGTGLSDPTPRAATLEERAQDLEAVMDAAGSQRAALLGISEGGSMALMFAATRPERTTALVLYGAFARLSRAPDYPEGIDEADIERLQTLVDRWGSGVGLAGWAPSRAGDDRLRRWFGRLQRSGASPSMARQMFAAYPDLDARCLLPTIAVPSLVIQRRDDRMVPPAMGRYLADHLPDARYVELEGGDHLYFVGDADAVLDEIELFLTGARHSHPADRAVRTILFADVVGSTDLAARLGDVRWRELLETFTATVRRLVVEGGGRVVGFSGDGFLATFDAPAAAIRSALAIRDELAAVGLDTRTGLHTGEVELLGDDVGGIGVHLAARVMATAETGEVLVSSTVRDLVVGSGIPFEPRGTHELRGVPGEWTLLAVG
jgi:pimeloyl-ACP methyl ester carboxylesterase